VFLATALGLGSSADAPPELVNPSPAIAGHVELGVELHRVVSLAVATSMARTWYSNTVEPPEMVGAGRLTLTRTAIGAVVEGKLPAGRVTPVLGAGAYLLKATAAASGDLLGIDVEYYRESDTTFALEGRAGADLRLSSAVELGVRASYTWYRADLPELTGGPSALGGLGLEARLTFDLTGFRPAHGGR
jgi:hypothetical protein